MIERIFGSVAARANWLVGLLCAAWLLALLQASVPDNDLLRALWSQNMAAWVQAVGSVGAIVWAARIAGRQSREALAREIRDQQRADRRELETRIRNTELVIHQMATVASNIKACASVIKSSGSVNSIAPLARNSVTIAVDALRAFPLSHIEDATVLRSASSVGSRGQSIVQYLDETWAVVKANPSQWSSDASEKAHSTLTGWAETMDKDINAASLVYAQLQAKFGQVFAV